MYPFERSLVQRLENRPFALLGVNTDYSKEQVHQVLSAEKITWRSWWDGGSVNGPISRRWKIFTWPTVFVLDAHGVIRYVSDPDRGVDDKAISRWVFQLVKETESGESD